MKSDRPATLNSGIRGLDVKMHWAGCLNILSIYCLSLHFFMADSFYGPSFFLLARCCFPPLRLQLSPALLLMVPPVCPGCGFALANQPASQPATHPSIHPSVHPSIHPAAWQPHGKSVGQLQVSYQTHIVQQYHNRMTAIWQLYDNYMTTIWQPKWQPIWQPTFHRQFHDSDRLHVF